MALLIEKNVFQIGSIVFPHNLIQGPLAGYSSAPFRESFSAYHQPAYCVTEMISAHDVLRKHHADSRYLYRSPKEGRLCYQLSGTKPEELAEAALRLEGFGADLIDINCGCPKPKIRKKGAGSALLETPEILLAMIQKVKSVISIPLTVKIRIQTTEKDKQLCLAIQESGADALIVHGRTYLDDYDKPCDYRAIRNIKSYLHIPVIANGDIYDQASLEKASQESACDAFMISRAGCGRPWLYAHLLFGEKKVFISERLNAFQQHMMGLSCLENEFQALLQSRSLMKYYFRGIFEIEELFDCARLDKLFEKIEHKVRELCAQGH